MRSSSVFRGLFVFIALLCFAGCNVNEQVIEVPDDEVECESDEECFAGTCENNRCVPFEQQGFLGDCDSDAECESGYCLEDPDGNFCTIECGYHADCAEGEGLICDFDESRSRSICMPGEEEEGDDEEEEEILPPVQGSVLCAGGAVSTGEGYRLEHCLAPTDLGGTSLRGNGIELQSGAFGVLGE